MQVFFERRELLTTDIWQYFFRPERPLDFVPGQYVDLVLSGVSGDQRGPTRTFTLTSLPDDELLSFVVKIPEPHSVYKEVLASLEAGTEAKITDAMGDLVLPKDTLRPLVFVAGGIGVASYVSMFRELLRSREERPIFFFYSLRDRREHLFRDLTGSYPLTLNMLTISPNRLTGRQILDTTPPDSFVYLSGSQRFVMGLQAQLEQAGTPRSHIVFDYYDGYTELE